MKQKFINELYKKLTFLSPSEKKKVIEKYKAKIASAKNKKKKNRDIIESFGNVDDIVKKELRKKKLKDSKYGLLSVANVIKSVPVALKNSYYRVFKLIQRDRNAKVERDIEQEITENIEVKNPTVFAIGSIPLTILVILLCLILLLLLIASVCISFAIFDGVKLYSLLIALVSLEVLCVQSIYLTERLIKKKIIRFKKEFKVFIACLIVIGISIGFTIVQYNNLEFVNDVSEKYGMILSKKEVNINNLGKKYYVRFNSWYKPKYVIEYDETLEDNLVIEIKYYEAFYDVTYKKDQNSIYISLAEDQRDKMSFYIDNLKNNKVYSEKELSRYTILIKFNEKNKDRIIFERDL